MSQIIQFNKRFKKHNVLARFDSKIKGHKYLKIHKNQLLIMDALMIHGSYNKKYQDKKDIFKYSEHSGLLDFNNKGLEKIIVSAKTNRIDKGDDELFMPNDLKESFDYEYIFHTHPATPRLGGRIKDGILYEFPSISDMFHFIDHYNDGSTQGSMVMAPEGLYNIRAVDNSKKIKMTYDRENKFYKAYRDIFEDTNIDAIEVHGKKFSDKYYYSKIASDTQYIDSINKMLKKYNLFIDYFPRIKNKKGQWIVDTIYIPIYPRE